MGWEDEYKRKLRHGGRSLAVRAVGHAGVYPSRLRRAGSAGGSADPPRTDGARRGNCPPDDLGHRGLYRARDGGHFRHNAMFIGGNVREAVNDGRADYTPVFLSEVEGLFESGQMPIDVALIQVSPPDAHGFCSFGVGVDTTLTAARCARFVIAQVNDQMPRTYGDSFIHVSQIDVFVETSRPLCELPAGDQRHAPGHRQQRGRADRRRRDAADRDRRDSRTRCFPS